MYTKTTLDNGLTVVTCPMPGTRSVGVALACGAGGCYERDEEAGISHFIEHLCFKGTTKRPTPHDVSSEIEGVGGMLNASTGREETVYFAKVTRSHLSTALDLLFDVTLHSKFEPVEIEKERQVVIEEINMNLDIPQQRVSMLIDSLLWPDQPLGRDIAGTKETVNSIQRGALLSYLGRQYRAGNVVACVAGDVEHEAVRTEIEALSTGFAPDTPDRSYRTDSTQSRARVGIDRRDGEQVHVCLGLHGMSRCDERRFAIDTLNVVLGGGMSSRLFTEIRENRGLAYDIHSYVEHFVTGGTFAVYAGVDPSKLEECIGAVLELLRSLKSGVSADELTRAKELTKGRLELRMEDTQNTALWCAGQELLNRQILTVEDVAKRIDAVTADDLVAVAEEYLVPEHLNVAVVGPVTGEIDAGTLAL